MIRTIGHAVIAYLDGGFAYAVAAWGLVLSGLLEWCAVWGYVAILCTLMRRQRDVRSRSALLAVRPYFGTMLCGWVVYASLNLVLLVDMVLTRAVVLIPPGISGPSEFSEPRAPPSDLCLLTAPVAPLPQAPRC